jgi:8-oxo-dGTP diphosphatase
MSAHADGKTYPKPALTADIVVIAPEPDGSGAAGLQVLLIRRGREPFAGRWALPGGFCEPDESIEQAAARELEEETGVAGVCLEQVRAFTAPGRDPRGWVVSVAHLALVPRRRLAEARGADDASEARWWSLRPGSEGYRLESGGELAGPLAFDHDAILAAALAQLVRDVDTLAPALLDEPFTRAELAWARGAVRALAARSPTGGKKAC